MKRVILLVLVFFLGGLPFLVAAGPRCDNPTAVTKCLEWRAYVENDDYGVDENGQPIPPDPAVLSRCCVAPSGYVKSTAGFSYCSYCYSEKYYCASKEWGNICWPGLCPGESAGIDPNCYCRLHPVDGTQLVLEVLDGQTYCVCPSESGTTFDTVEHGAKLQKCPGSGGGDPIDPCGQYKDVKYSNATTGTDLGWDSTCSSFSDGTCELSCSGADMGTGKKVGECTYTGKTSESGTACEPGTASGASSNECSTGKVVESDISGYTECVDTLWESVEWMYDNCGQSIFNSIVQGAVAGTAAGAVTGSFTKVKGASKSPAGAALFGATAAVLCWTADPVQSKPCPSAGGHLAMIGTDCDVVVPTVKDPATGQNVPADQAWQDYECDSEVHSCYPTSEEQACPFGDEFKCYGTSTGPICVCSGQLPNDYQNKSDIPENPNAPPAKCPFGYENCSGLCCSVKDGNVLTDEDCGAECIGTNEDRYHVWVDNFRELYPEFQKVVTEVKTQGGRIVLSIDGLKLSVNDVKTEVKTQGDRIVSSIDDLEPVINSVKTEITTQGQQIQQKLDDVVESTDKISDEVGKIDDTLKAESQKNLDLLQQQLDEMQEIKDSLDKDHCTEYGLLEGQGTPLLGFSIPYISGQGCLVHDEQAVDQLEILNDQVDEIKKILDKPCEEDCVVGKLNEISDLMKLGLFCDPNRRDCNMYFQDETTKQDLTRFVNGSNIYQFWGFDISIVSEGLLSFLPNFPSSSSCAPLSMSGLGSAMSKLVSPFIATNITVNDLDVCPFSTIFKSIFSWVLFVGASLSIFSMVTTTFEKSIFLMKGGIS